MLTLNDIINVSFRKSGFSGYRTEDVDNFIDLVKDSYDALIKKNIEQKEQNEKLIAEIKQMQSKLEVLAGRIEEYRGEEDEIKSALVSAQKLGDASIREARHKSEIIIKDANIKAERMITGAQEEAKHIITAAKEDLASQSKQFDDLKKAVSDFRSKLLAAYKEHLTLIDALPTKQEASAESVEPEKTAYVAAEEAPAESQPELTKPEAYELEPAAELESAIEPESEPEIEIPSNLTSEAADESTGYDATERFADPIFSSQATQNFHIDPSNFETKPASEQSYDHDMRYDVLKFGDNYDISQDNESPAGIFNRDK